MNNYVYRYEQFVVKKTTDGNFVVVNTKSSYECHSHVKSIQAGKALCKLRTEILCGTGDPSDRPRHRSGDFTG